MRTKLLCQECAHRNDISQAERNRETVWTTKVKVRVSLCFNWAPRHEGI